MQQQLERLLVPVLQVACARCSTLTEVPLASDAVSAGSQQGRAGSIQGGGTCSKCHQASRGMHSLAGGLDITCMRSGGEMLPYASGAGVSWTHASQAVASLCWLAALLCQPFPARWNQNSLAPLQDWPMSNWSAVCTFLQLLPTSLFLPLQDWLLSLVPHLVHAASNVLADVTATGCHLRDLLPSMLAGQCGGCSAAAVFRWGYDKAAVT